MNKSNRISLLFFLIFLLGIVGIILYVNNSMNRKPSPSYEISGQAVVNQKVEILFSTKPGKK